MRSNLFPGHGRWATLAILVSVLGSLLNPQAAFACDNVQKEITVSYKTWGIALHNNKSNAQAEAERLFNDYEVAGEMIEKAKREMRCADGCIPRLERPFTNQDPGKCDGPTYDEPVFPPGDAFIKLCIEYRMQNRDIRETREKAEESCNCKFRGSGHPFFCNENKAAKNNQENGYIGMTATWSCSVEVTLHCEEPQKEDPINNEPDSGIKQHQAEDYTSDQKKSQISNAIQVAE